MGIHQTLKTLKWSIRAGSFIPKADIDYNIFSNNVKRMQKETTGIAAHKQPVSHEIMRDGVIKPL